MRYLYIAVLVLVTAALAIGATPAQKSPGSKTIEKLSSQKLEFAIPEVGKTVERVQFDNGMVIYLNEDHRLPTFNLSTMIHCGDIYDAADKSGLSSLVGTVMRTGGSKTVSGDSMNNVFEFIGGSLETGIRGEQGSVSLSVLSKDIDLGLGLYADLLRNPAFPQDKLDLAKADIKNMIKRRNDNPGGVANRYYSNLLYGDHPNGRILEWATIKGITPEDLMAYHQKFFVPNNMILAISGDFKRDDVLAKLKQYFGDWKKSEAPLPTPPEVTYGFKPGVYEVIKDVNQANIQIGQLGIKRDNPDRYALALMNYILGGGSFTSRLTSRVRSDEGLAYHVSSSYETGSRDYGTFTTVCQTKSATCYKATRIIMDEIQRIRTEGVTAAELEDARNSYINRFVFTWDSPSKTVQNLAGLEFDGFPADFYKNYVSYYQKVTADDIKAVAEKYLSPDKMTILVVGKPATFDKPLDEFGKVTTIDLADPILD